MNIKVNSVVQINENYEALGWVGAFVLVTEVKKWGVQGFVHHLKTRNESLSAYIRLPWDKIDYIGQAALIPHDSEPDEKSAA